MKPLINIALVVALAFAPAAEAKDTISSIERRILDYVSALQENAAKAAKYAAGSSKYWQYMNNALSAARVIKDAWTIGEGLQKLAGSRDDLAEEAFQDGWENGITDADRFWSNPKAAWIDVDWRAYYRRYGRLYESAYVAGHASGFEYAMKRHRSGH